MIVFDWVSRVLDLASRFAFHIVDYAVGIKYAYCVLGCVDRTCMGLSFVPRLDIYTYRISEKPEVRNLAGIFRGQNMLNRTLALSCINAVSQYFLWIEKMSSCDISMGNLSEFLVRQIRKDDNVVVIGNMVPLVRKLREASQKIFVFERDPLLRIGGAMPDYLEYEYLERADVVIITGVTILNGTIDPILRYSEGARMRCIVGPTAQLFPDIILEKVDVVASLKVDDVSEVADIIKRGGGRWSYSKFCTEYIALK